VRIAAAMRPEMEVSLQRRGTQNCPAVLLQFHRLLDMNPYYLKRAIAAAFLGAVCLIFSILPWNRMMDKSKDG
jgi:hypothetical protein